MSSCGCVKQSGPSPLVGVVGTPIEKSGTRVAPTACSAIKESVVPLALILDTNSVLRKA